MPEYQYEYERWENARRNLHVGGGGGVLGRGGRHCREAEQDDVEMLRYGVQKQAGPAHRRVRPLLSGGESQGGRGPHNTCF